MERMLRMNKNNSEYEIDRELTGKLAIESNAELQDRVEELEEENKKLKEKVSELEETLEHRDSILSIMYDLLRSDLSDYEQLCMIYVVIDVEVGNEPQNKFREELLDRFRKRDF